MRFLVISDIHGNLEALDAVLGAMRAQGFDHALVLGDLVGYGADPNAVIDRVRSLEPLTIIRGNHDKVASGLENGESFNLVARSAVQWTYEMLTPENLDYLLKLQVADIGAYDRVYKQLIAAARLQDVSASFAMEELKHTHAVPLPAATAPRTRRAAAS